MIPRDYRGAVAVLATMHAKERVIAPVLRAELGLNVELATRIDTDRFGTFSREVTREGSPLDAARAKIAAGLAEAPQARVGLASEGSFGAHPLIPLMAVGRELVLMRDRDTGFELTGHDAGPRTNYGHVVARDLDEACAFARRAGFPDHGLIVMGCNAGQPAPEVLLLKDVIDEGLLEAAVGKAIGQCGAAFVETDMRAHRNPTRMAAIERATRDLARRFHSRCPSCDHPGFVVTERIAGLPCAWCGQPTGVIMSEVLACPSCGHRVERPATTARSAEPGQCAECNP